MAPLIYLITGCSSGFGAEYVPQILARGDKVIATARNASRIKSLEEQGAATLELDVTWPQDKIDAAFAAAIEIYGHIDVLVNNAGYVAAGFLEESTPEQWQQNFDTNVFGSVKCSRAILPHFRSRKSGLIFFTSSLASYGGGAGVSIYCSTKAAVSSIAESLASEVNSLGIQVICIEPGYFRTDLLSGNNLSLAPDSSIADYGSAPQDAKRLYSSVSGNQAGDVKKGIKVMLDLVEAAKSGVEMPVRLPVGADVVEYIQTRYPQSLESLKAREEVASSTNIDGVNTPPVKMLGLYLEK